MEINQELLDKIHSLAKYRHGPRTICRLLELSLPEEKALLLLFEDPDSEVSRTYDTGNANADQEVDKHLERHVEAGGEGAGEAARALGYLRRQRKYTDLKKDLFGV